MSSAFMKSINAFVDKANANCEEIVKKAAIDMFNEIIAVSPLGNPSLWKGNAPEGYVGGRFRGNWQVSFNVPVLSEVDRNNKNDPNGSVTLNEGTEKILEFNSNVNAIYFTNNLPYAYRLEVGHSSQAPNGIIRIVAINGQKYFDDAARGLKNA